MADFATPSTSRKRKKRSSPKCKDLRISVRSFAKKLFKLSLNAKNSDNSRDDRKKYAKYGLESVFETEVASLIRELVLFMMETPTIDVADDLTQIQRDIQEISESDGSSTSANDASPQKNKKPKTLSPNFENAKATAINLAVLLFDIKLDLASDTLSDQIKKGLVVNALKLIHSNDIIGLTQKLQHILKEIEKEEKSDQREPPQNSHSPTIDATEANDSSTTRNEASPLFADILPIDDATYTEQLLSNKGSQRDCFD